MKELILLMAMTENNTSQVTEQKVRQGLDFILSHFQEPKWPRKISTYATEGKQVIVSTKEGALVRFKQANFVDCRINAYAPNATDNPSEVGKVQGVMMRTPAIIIVMVDLDRQSFNSDITHKNALSATLKNIKDKLRPNVEPTVLWSGNGYHVYLPIDSNGISLENEEIFTKLCDKDKPSPSQEFLRFAEHYISDGKSDHQHNNTVSFKNCMLRIPGSYNSKFIQINNRVLDSSTEIKVIQRWNGYRPPINYILRDFRRHLIQKRIEYVVSTRKRKGGSHSTLLHVGKSHHTNEIMWIESLLLIPIMDGRKFVLWRILAPYLLNVKGLSYEQSFHVMEEWLAKCNTVERLRFNHTLKIREALKRSRGYFPISLEKLRNEYAEIYKTVVCGY